MAMLAQPKQRKRYNLVPRGKPLYEDGSRFGTKMLEKMGWKSGEGLGATGNGVKDFVRIRYKNDILGLGFEERDDQWTQHEQSFDGLLKTLNNGENSCDSNIGGDDENDDKPRVGFGFHTESVKTIPKLEKMKEKISGISLEEKSKQSRARVHYKKFTKGKDLSQYSEKDLANIFGKKAVAEQPVANDVFQQISNNFDKNKEYSEGVQMINTGVSVTDYFKEKMAAIKSRKPDSNKEENSNNGSSDTEPNGEEVTVTKKKKKQENIAENINSEIEAKDEDLIAATKKKKKKKDRKVLENDTNPDIDLTNLQEIVDNADQQNDTDKETNIIQKTKKSKKRETVETVEEVPTEETQSKKKKHKSKNKALNDTPNDDSKAKKRKVEESLTEKTPSENSDPNSEIASTQEPMKKKKKKTKKSKEINELNVDVELETNQADEANNFKSSSSKKSPDTVVNENNTSQHESIADQSSEKPRKSKKKDVSSSAQNTMISEVDFQQSDLDEIKNKYKAFNICEISSFCAEKFRKTNLSDFVGSTLSQIEGYGFDADIQLNVQCIENDDIRIMNLWRGVLNKYHDLAVPKNPYQQYFKNSIDARNANLKKPKLCIKKWKRKNAFQAI